MHSIVSCLHHYNPSVDKHDVYAFLLHSLRAECLRNSNLYLPLFENISVFDEERDRYIFQKDYNLSFVDLVPQMFANVLCFGITVINVESKEKCDVYEFIPADVTKNSSIHFSKILNCPSRILLYRHSYHYDACIPICFKTHSNYSEIRSDVSCDIDKNDLSTSSADGVGQHYANADPRHLPVTVTRSSSGVNSFPLAEKIN